jgi:cell division transport system permease protein
MRLQFILSETLSGLRRNLSMVISVVLVALATVTLVGLSWLAQRQVDASKDYWYDKVEVSIFLCGSVSSVASCSDGEVTQAQKDQIQQQLDSLKPLVQKIYFESKDQAFARFTEQFKGSAIVKGVTADQMPESYRVKLDNPKKFDVIASSFNGAPGVELVQDQRELLKPLFNIITYLTYGALLFAGIMVILYLLINTTMIRLSAYTRRRETGIMRLVGASNFTIQMPFILETVLATFVGGVLAIGLLWSFVHFFVEGVLSHATRVTNFIGVSAVLTTAPWLLLGGVVLAAAVSAVTLRFYLRV